ncbi:unnamed protein product [Kluyveromyces dobzhanskii CBS 2104]|uniref:WGS project CCBQ000000000 data, contig 00106 n=1 Tax=Kluyveromyces dobzhanskii CBS 2104 TaxID=1427455 RepID=A0A0A8L850_9SACH|nr:unnamed protein product [Kluyveromyces dobzhanskii CBS 2104]
MTEDNADTTEEEKFKDDQAGNGVSKRQRISFVCQACRKNKTKCDREKPRCGRCVKYHSKCVYDVEQQKPPRVPSKDAIIKRLTGEVEYWRNKATGCQISSNVSATSLSDAESFHHSSKRQRTEDGVSLLADVSISRSNSAASKVDSPVILNSKEIQLNFYREFPQLTMKYAMKRDIKPISAFAHVYRDKLLSLFVASIFSSASKSALIHSISSDDTNPFQKSQMQFKQNAIFLRDSMVQLCETDIEKQKVYEFTERIMGEQVAQKEQSTLFVSLLKARLENKHVEDSCPHGVVSVELTRLKDSLELALPSVVAIEVYMMHFYQYIYPIIPFLDIELFEEGLADLLQPSDGTDGRRVKINFGTRNIRSKICLLSALINILRISYLCIAFTLNNSRSHVIDDATRSVLRTDPIDSNLVMLSQDCISSVNILSWTTENGLIALMYHWAVFVFTPEEGDCYLGQPTDALISLVSNLAVNIGLHRDPHEYKILEDPSICDPRVLNLRKRLWLCIFIMCRHETTLKARYHQNNHMSSFAFSSSHDQAKGSWCYDFGDPNIMSHYNLSMNNKIIKRHQIFLLLSETDAVTMNLDTHMTLFELDGWFSKVKTFLDEEFPLDDLINGESTSKFHDLLLKNDKRIPVDFTKSDNALCFQTHLIARISMLRISTCLMVHFENRLSDMTHDYSQLFMKYFLESFKSLLEVVKLYQSYLTGDYDASLSPYMLFATDKICEVCLPSILLTLLGMLIRITDTESTFINKTVEGKGLYSASSYVPEEMKETKNKLITITAIKRGLEVTMQNLLALITTRLRFAFFSTFKISIFLDYVLQIVKKQDILNVLKRVYDLNFSHKVRREIYMGTGIDINDKQGVLLSLEKGNRISLASNETFEEVLAMMNALQLCNQYPETNAVLNESNGVIPDVTNSTEVSDKVTDKPSLIPVQNGNSEPPESELLDSCNMTSLLNGATFDFFDYDFLLGPTE